MKPIKIFLIFFLTLFFLSGCSNPVNEVSNDLEKNLSLLTQGNEESIEEIILETNSTNDNLEYKELITKIVKNLKYEIVSVEKIDETINVSLKLTNIKIDSLVTEYYNSIVKDRNDSIMKGKIIVEDELISNGIKKMLSTYSVLKDSSETINVKLIYKKDINKSWILTNKSDYFEGVLGGMFSKMNNFSKNQLPELFLKEFFTSFKTIKPGNVKQILKSENLSQNEYEFDAKYYNAMNFKIINHTRTENQTLFNVEIDVVDAKLIVEDYVKSYVDFYKKSIMGKETPIAEELTKKSLELLMSSLEKNKGNIITLNTDIIIDDSLKIINKDEFFNKILANLNSASIDVDKKIREQIQTIFKE